MKGDYYKPKHEGDYGPKREADRLVTVCAVCRCASCWQGEFYCQDYKTAGTIDLPISELRKLKLEHPSYWRKP